ncbi:hypothetical protein NP522_19810 [Pseudomonas guariconensis]|uniref:hypothetical protein n=1 Tax=Pseudomonas guariconensis TaxID=1288410 RepID=UPI0023632081|nr:hypothetical protein [Pseudomonas guariconensis]MDD2092435.1 hypothetical protein [Pseudomonas guariconensis]
MPWYRTGQVAITAGQTTVTGTGTSFSANGRVGDGFLGPDGRWYEITNIASDTVLSILPAYQGATVSGGSYAIAPLQGYPKTLADTFNDIANQWGATLAGLGSVSVEDIVPVAKGGTGANTAANARANLGLGSAATATLTTTDTDITVGRVLKVKDHGVGGATGTNSAGSTLDSIAANSFFASTDQLPSDWPPGAGTYPAGINLYRSASVRAQLAISYGTAASGAGVYYRQSQGGLTTWSKLLERREIVGTVSQSSGSPTGAIIERGSNANGEYTKYADGTMECWLQATVTDQACDTASGTLFFGTRSWTYPAAFVGVPAVQMSSRIGTGISWGGLGGAPSNTTATARLLDTVSRAAGVSTVLSFTAKGRWF